MSAREIFLHTKDPILEPGTANPEEMENANRLIKKAGPCGGPANSSEMKELIDAMRFESGCQRPWKHVCNSFEAPRTLLEFLKDRQTCVLEIMELINKYAIPGKRLIGLEGWWMKQTALATTRNILIVVDTTFCFVDQS